MNSLNNNINKKDVSVMFLHMQELMTLTVREIKPTCILLPWTQTHSSHSKKL